MTTSADTASPAAPSWTPDRPLESSVRDYFTLLKPGVMSLVVFTGITGMVIAPGTMHPLVAATVILCIAVGSGAGGAINMWYDRDIDAGMLRTLSRPIPAGRIAPENALTFGLFLALASVSLMGLAAGWLPAGILAFAIAFYVGIYTMWLKRRTPQNIVIGGAAGAFPPVIGWAAVTGSIAWEPLVLFLIVFLWTPPHFWALALYRNQDYTRVGVPMLPVVAGPQATRTQIMIYTVALWFAALLPVGMGFAGMIYLIACTLINAGFCWHAVRVWRSDNDKNARQMFLYSIYYLFVLFGALIVDRLFA